MIIWLLVVAVVGILASVVLLLLGLVWGERLLAVAAGIALAAFLGAVVWLGTLNALGLLVTVLAVVGSGYFFIDALRDEDPDRTVAFWAVVAFFGFGVLAAVYLMRLL